MSAYAPAMMVRVLLYGYATGHTAHARSRLGPMRMWRSVIFCGRASGPRYICGVSQASSGGAFGLFTQALLLCEKAGLVKLGHVSIDGTKIKANASKHKAMSYARMERPRRG